MGGSSISFDVSFGEAPVLLVTYLKSYEAMGTASLAIRGDRPEETVELSGKYLSFETQERVSQAHTAIWNVRAARWPLIYWHQNPECCPGRTERDLEVADYSVKPFSRHNVTLTTGRTAAAGRGGGKAASKFKILSVSSC